MEDKKISFEVEGFSVLDDYSDAQLAIVEIYVCHDGNNLHNMPIDLSVLKAAKKTLKNKFLVAGYDGEDFEGHEPDEVIVGFFPESSKMSFKQKDGKTYLVAQAIMSKIYAKWAYDIFVEENERAVSMEITVLDTEETDGLTAITKFVFNGVTLLGKSHLPACEGADASIIKFSTENALKVYSKCFRSSSKIKKDFVNTMNLAENSGKEGTDTMEGKENEVVVKTVENTEPVVEVTEEPKVDVVDYEDKENDNTTHMEDDEENKDNDKDEDKDNEDKSDDDKSDDNKDFESLTVEQKYEVFRAAIKDAKHIYGYLESYDDEYLYVYNYDDGFTYRYSYTLNGTNVELTEDAERVMRGGYVPFESEQSDAKPEVDTDKDADNETMEALKTENCELKEKVAQYETKAKEDKVEIILSNVVDDLDSDAISELREKSKNYSIDELNVFENEVKAIAFETVKKSKGKYSFTRMTINEYPKSENSNPYGW